MNLELGNFIENYECLSKETQEKIKKQIFAIAEYLTDLECDK